MLYSGSEDYATICKVTSMVKYPFIALQASTIAMAPTVRVQYLRVDAFGCHWFTTEIAILHAYRPVGAGLIT
jgi:hypothetical protein